MNIRDRMQEIDTLFDQGKEKEACHLMETSLMEAREEKDWGAELSLLNELMGYYRHIGLLEHAKKLAADAQKIVEEHRLGEKVDGATTFLNIATVYRVCKEYERAMVLYKKVENIYAREQLMHDFRAGGLYNNMCVAYLELEQYPDAFTYGKKALDILEHFPEAKRERDIVAANVAQAKKMLDEMRNA